MKQFGLSAAMAAACVFLSSTAALAQLPPRQNPEQIQRARQACDAAASRYGYRVMRRDQENVNGSQYSLPMHVSHGSTEADVTCSYDYNRGVAVVPQWDDRTGRIYNGNGRDRDRDRDRDEDRDRNRSRDDRYNNGSRYNNNGLSDMQYRAQQECQTAINGRPGFRVSGMGTPLAHGARQWDVPLTVRRDGREQQSVTCRYNTANGKVTLR